jgi:hypothetical protein
MTHLNSGPVKPRCPHRSWCRFRCCSISRDIWTGAAHLAIRGFGARQCGDPTSGHGSAVPPQGQAGHGSSPVSTEPPGLPTPVRLQSCGVTGWCDSLRRRYPLARPVGHPTARAAPSAPTGISHWSSRRERPCGRRRTDPAGMCGRGAVTSTAGCPAGSRRGGSARPPAVRHR